MLTLQAAPGDPAVPPKLITGIPAETAGPSRGVHRLSTHKWPQGCCVCPESSAVPASGFPLAAPQALSREVFLMTQLREGEVPHGSGHPNLLAPQFEIWFWTIRLGRPWAAGFGTARLTVYTAQYWKGGDRLLGGARAQLQGISQGRPHTFHQHLIIKKQPPLPASMFT